MTRTARNVAALIFFATLFFAPAAASTDTECTTVWSCFDSRYAWYTCDVFTPYCNGAGAACTNYCNTYFNTNPYVNYCSGDDTFTSGYCYCFFECII